MLCPKSTYNQLIVLLCLFHKQSKGAPLLFMQKWSYAEIFTYIYYTIFKKYVKRITIHFLNLIYFIRRKEGVMSIRFLSPIHLKLYTSKKPTNPVVSFLLVHRKVEEACTRPPPSKPIILREKWGFWGIFALFFNFARNLILADYLEPASTKSGRFEL